MPRRSARRASSPNPPAVAPASPDDAASTPCGAAAPAPEAAPEPPRERAGGPPPGGGLLSLLAPVVVFGLASAGMLALAWPGYRIKAATREAERAIAEGRPADAIPRLEFVVSKYPSASVRQTQLGDCYLEVGRPDDALAAYRKSLRYDDSQTLEAAMGRAEYLRGNHPEAIRLLQAALQRDPREPRANYYIALYYMDEDPARGRRRDLAKAAYFFQAATADASLLEKSRPHLDRIRQELLGS